jgi:LysM repeat protein
MVAAAMPVANAPAPASYHVKWGDTLSQIALDFYGSASDYPQIQDANPQVIQDPNLIYAGDTLKIPGAHATDAASLDTEQVAPPASTHVPRHAAYTPRHAKASAPVSARHSAVHTFSAVANGNLVQIARYLMNHGATRAAAAGITACIWGESGGNAESVGSGGFGLIGWTGNTIGLPGGFSGPTGNVTFDMNAELIGVVGYINANGGFGIINSAGGPVAAAQAFSSHFERPAVMFSDIHFGGAGDPTAIFNAI